MLLLYYSFFPKKKLHFVECLKTRTDRVWWDQVNNWSPAQMFAWKYFNLFTIFVSFTVTSMFIFTGQTRLFNIVEKGVVVKSCHSQLKSIKNNKKRFLISDHTARWAHEYAETSSLHRGANNKKERFGLYDLYLTFVTYKHVFLKVATRLLTQS